MVHHSYVIVGVSHIRMILFSSAQPDGERFIVAVQSFLKISLVLIQRGYRLPNSGMSGSFSYIMIIFTIIALLKNDKFNMIVSNTPIRYFIEHTSHLIWVLLCCSVMIAYNPTIKGYCPWVTPWFHNQQTLLMVVS